MFRFIGSGKSLVQFDDKATLTDHQGVKVRFCRWGNPKIR